MDDTAGKGITASELKELRRVFDYLADYVPKKKIYKQLNPLLERRQKLNQAKKASFDTKIQDANGNLMTEDQIDAEIQELSGQIDQYQAQIDVYDNAPNRKVHAKDLSGALLSLGKKCSKKEIEDLIWEVDENLDGCVDWGEFKLMVHSVLVMVQIF